MKNKALTLFSIFGIIVVLCFCLFNFVLFPTKYQKFVNKYSSQFGVEKSLVFAVIKAESGFDKNATSSAGALGLMQLLPQTASFVAEKFGETFKQDNLFDAETNIKYGCFYLKYIFEKFNDIEIVICAYNAGEGRVRAWIDDDGKLDKSKIDIVETKNYLQKVLKYYEIYKMKFCFD